MKVNMFRAPRSLAFRTSRPAQVYSGVRNSAACRTYASDQGNGLPTAEGEQPEGPNMQTPDHVSEEAAKMAKMTGGDGQDLDVGTPVQDVCTK